MQQWREEKSSSRCLKSQAAFSIIFRWEKGPLRNAGKADSSHETINHVGCCRWKDRVCILADFHWQRNLTRYWMASLRKTNGRMCCSQNITSSLNRVTFWTSQMCNQSSVKRFFFLNDKTATRFFLEKPPFFSSDILEAVCCQIKLHQEQKLVKWPTATCKAKLLLQEAPPFFAFIFSTSPVIYTTSKR